MKIYIKGQAKKVGLIGLGLASLILIGFQNCGKTGFKLDSVSATGETASSSASEDTVAEVTGLNFKSPEVTKALSDLSIDVNTIGADNSPAFQNLIKDQNAQSSEYNPDNCSSKGAELNLDAEVTVLKALAGKQSQQDLRNLTNRQYVAGTCAKERVTVTRNGETRFQELPALSYGPYISSQVCELRRESAKACLNAELLNPSAPSPYGFCSHLNEAEYFDAQATSGFNALEDYILSIENIKELASVDAYLKNIISPAVLQATYGNGLDTAKIKVALEKALNPRKKTLLNIYKYVLTSARAKVAEHLTCNSPFARIAPLFSKNDGINIADPKYWSFNYSNGLICQDNFQQQNEKNEACNAVLGQGEVVLPKDILIYGRSFQDPNFSKFAVFGTNQNLQNANGYRTNFGFANFVSTQSGFVLFSLSEDAMKKVDSVAWLMDTLRFEKFATSQTLVETILKSKLEGTFNKFELVPLIASYFDVQLARTPFWRWQKLETLGGSVTGANRVTMINTINSSLSGVGGISWFSTSTGTFSDPKSPASKTLATYINQYKTFRTIEAGIQSRVSEYKTQKASDQRLSAPALTQQAQVVNEQSYKEMSDWIDGQLVGFEF